MTILVSVHVAVTLTPDKFESETHTSCSDFEMFIMQIRKKKPVS